jgi:hypothetical protein
MRGSSPAPFPWRSSPLQAALQDEYTPPACADKRVHEVQVTKPGKPAMTERHFHPDFSCEWTVLVDGRPALIFNERV